MNYSILQRIRSFIFVILSFCILSCTPTSAPQQKSAAPPADDNILRIGVTAVSPPLVYKEGGKITGLEIDFALQLAKYLGKEIRFVELPWEKQIPTLEEGGIDIIMSGMTITNKRAYRVAFAQPYLQSGQVMLIRMEHSRRFSRGVYSLMDSNYLIGTIKSTTGDFFITKTINQARMKRFTSPGEAVKELISGDIDVFVYDAPMQYYYASVHELEKLTPATNLLTSEHLAWAVNRNNPELLEDINSFLEVNRANNTLKKTIRRWIPNFY